MEEEALVGAPIQDGLAPRCCVGILVLTAVALEQAVGNEISAICYDVLCCPYPNDEHVHLEGVESVTDHDVENVICQEVAMESVIFHEAVEVMVNVIVHQEEVLVNVIDVFLQERKE